MDSNARLNWRAITVEVIRRLWDRGLLRSNPWLKRVHENWFEVWSQWRTDLTMETVDRQAEAIVEQWEAEDAAKQAPVFSEQQDGETLLGGPMQLSHPKIGRLP